MKTKIFLLIIFYSALSYFFEGKTLGDVIFLMDGSVLNGKVVKRNKENIIFRNSHGSYDIKQKRIDKFFITKNYLEDIKILKSFKIKVIEKNIKKNYLAGEQYKSNEKPMSLDADLEFETNISPLPKHIIYILGDYNRIYGPIRDVMKQGYSAYLAYAFSLPAYDITGPVLNFSILIEPGYFNFYHGINRLYGPILIGGCGLKLPGDTSKYGSANFTVLGGITYTISKSGNKKKERFKYTLHTKLGYQYSIDRFIPFLNLRYIYIIDIAYPLHSIAVEAGIGLAL